MRLSTIISALVIVSDLSGSARADLVGPPGAPPFDDGDRVEIARDEILRVVVDRDPWLVRHILDLEKRDATGVRRTEPERRDASGSVEWMALLRRAKAEKGGNIAVGQSVSPSSRSSEGSIEMFDLMKAAKRRKDNR